MLPHCDQLPPTKRRLLLWDEVHHFSSFLPIKCFVGQLLIGSKQVVLFELLTSLVVSFDLNSTCLDLLLQHASDIQSASFLKMIFSVQPFPLPFFQSHVSSSDFLNLAQVFSPSFDNPLNPSLPEWLFSSSPFPPFYHSHSFCGNICSCIH